jgi:hypothetical protein
MCKRVMSMKNFKNSPLWLIAFFMTIAEGFAGYAVTQVSGNSQIAILVFFIGYALIVTGVFFAFLWHKPANFYGPSEYGNLPPNEYAQALAGLPSEAANAVDIARLNPLDEDSVFKVMDTLLPEETKQHLILMSKNNNQLDLPDINDMGHTHRFEIILRNHGVSVGLFSPKKFVDKLDGTGLVTYLDMGKQFFLSDRGKRFVEWLQKHERDAETFISELGGWGKQQSVQDVLSKRFNNITKSSS